MASDFEKAIKDLDKMVQLSIDALREEREDDLDTAAVELHENAANIRAIMLLSV